MPFLIIIVTMIDELLINISFLHEEVFLIPNWQWISIILILALGYFISSLIAIILIKILENLLRKNKFAPQESQLYTRLTRPINLIFLGWFWFLGLSLFGISNEAIGPLNIAAKVLTISGFLLTGLRFTDLISHYMMKRAESTDSKFDDLLVPLLSRSLKTIIVLLSLLSGAEILDFPITSLLAGLGIGGLAIAMAAKDTISNIFGSLTIVTDRPFQIGDWVKIGEHEGTVEKLGFRSTRVRTFYNSLISVPNALLLTATVDNFGARRYRRIKTMLSLTYDTPTEKINAFCDGVKEIIKNHPFTRKDYFHVNLNQFSSSSLDVLLYCFLETPDWGKELEERHSLFIQIIDCAKTLDVEFAYPTQTLFMKQES